MQEKKKKKNNLNNILGPVEDLESYVKADWWKEIFNANYLRTDGDVVNDEGITFQEIDIFISLLDLKKDNIILDLCCGQGRHIFNLANRGFQNLYGLDRSHYLITKARSKNKLDGFNIKFKEGDARKLPFKYDFFDYLMILGNSFGYFESHNDDYQVLKEALRILKPNGKILIDLTDGEYIKQNFAPRSWEWIDKDYFVCRERCLSKDNERLISREIINHATKGVVTDQFYAERLYSIDSIKDLLKSSGFSNVKFHQDLFTSSMRNQDLGMMEKRIIISAEAKKEWTSVKHKEIKQSSVIVILGDPNISDIVKPDAVFNEDDFYTIKELKIALSELKDYQFKYIDNHKTLLNDLIKHRESTDFILNLCDEGFNNEPTKELHVPSLLEILNIPYSGGTPQCLAFCYDKSLVRGIAKELDLPVPNAFTIKPDNTTFIDFSLQFPVIVKPNLGDSSFGITKDNVCYNIKQLESIIIKTRDRVGYESVILVEEFLTGKDLSVGIIGNLPDSYIRLPIIEEDYSLLPEGLPQICGYEAKWDSESPYWKTLRSIPADLSEEVTRFLEASCLTLFSRLECRDYARFDWRMDSNGTPRLLEVNPNPGWCWDGHLAKMAKLVGHTYADMLKLILNSAKERLGK